MKVLALAAVLSFSSGAAGAQVPDAALLVEIRAIRAVDNHSHIPPASTTPAADEPADLAGATPFHYPVRLRVDNPEWMRAWNGLYGVRVTSMNSSERRTVHRKKRELMAGAGDAWPAAVLDRVNIETALANIPSLGTGQQSNRFRWVPHANSLLYPFGGIGPNEVVREIRHPDSLDAYVRDVIGGTLRRWDDEGAVAIKLSVAYSRSLDFAAVPSEAATAIYARHVAAATAPPATEYKQLQDFLFREVAREAGRLGLAVHIHTGVGADPYFALAGANPLLLEPALNDEALRSTRFVMIHGGWPFDRQAGAMLLKPNVYADFSAQTFLRSPRALADTLRGWLEWYPEKVLFGSDTYPDPNTPLCGWEELLWLANDSARKALAIALTGMVNDGGISRARALEIARMVLRDNARALYGLGGD